MGRSILDCIHQSNIKARDLPPTLVDIVANKKKSTAASAAAIIAIDEHIASLNKQKDRYTARYTKITSEFNAEAVSGTPAGKYTGREKTDPDNELNLFSISSYKKLANNVLQRFGSMTGILNQKFLDKKKIDAAEKAAITDFHDNFLPGFSSELEKVFKPKTQKGMNFRFEDFIQYFPERTDDGSPTLIQYKDADGKPLMNKKGQPITSKLDPVLKGAIAASAYEWLANNAGKLTVNDKQAIKRILGLDDKAVLPENASQYLSDAGMSADMIAEQIGQMVVDKLAIKAGTENDYYADRRLRLSLGFMALATMENMKLVDRQEIYTGRVSETEIPINIINQLKAEAKKNKVAFVMPVIPEEDTFGLSGLKSFTGEITREQVYVNTDQSKADLAVDKIGTPTAKFYRILTDRFHPEFGYPITPSHLVKSEELLKAAPDAFNKLFNTEPKAQNYSWKKQLFPKRMRLGRTPEQATTEQTNNLIKYSHIAYVNNKDVTDLFLELGKPDNNSFLNQILGISDYALRHRSREHSVKGNNIGIERDIAAVHTWLGEAEQRNKDGQTTHFYIPNFFYKTGRMGQSGDVNPQQSKMHRALFSQMGWATTFVPEPGSRLQDKTGLDRSFHEAVAFAFDIESGKEGGIDNQLDKLEAFLSQGIIKEALVYIQEFQDGVFLTDSQKQVIADAVGLGENKTHSLKGLVEYARYKNHKGINFTTDLYKEIDGISNGPTIGSIQLVPDASNKNRIAATLSMAGFNFSNRNTNVDERLGNKWLHDAYQRMGLEWAYEINSLKTQSHEKQDYKTLRQIDALSFLLGDFTDEKGIVSGMLRNLSKPRTMQTTFGAGIEKQTNILSFENVIQEGIYDRLEKMSSELRKEDLDESEYQKQLTAFTSLLGSVNELVGRSGKYAYVITPFMKNGRLNADEILNFDIEYGEKFRIKEAVESTYGAAMENAVETTFAGLLSARKPFIADTQLATSMYNFVLKHKIDAQKQFNDGKPITKGQMESIIDSIDNMVPRVKTPLYDKKTDQGYLPITETDSRKLYEEDGAAVSASYASKTVASLKSHVSGSPFLARPGVAPIINVIHMLDSMVANHLMSFNTNFLNNHDGFSHSIKDSEHIRTEANKRFYELMKDYSLGSVITEMREQVMEEGNRQLASMGIPIDSFWNQMVNDGLVNVDTLMKFDKIPESGEEAYKKNFYKGITFGDRAALNAKLRDAIKTRDVVALVNQAINTIEVDASRMALQTETNKAEFMNSVTQMAQYSDGGIGYNIPGAVSQEQLFTEGLGTPVVTEGITRSDEANSQRTSHSIASMVYANQQELGSSNDGPVVSTNVDDYKDGRTEVIDGKNAVEVFDSLQAVDDAAVYGSVRVSPEHTNHLKRILTDIVSTVMRPVDLYINTHTADRQTQGLITMDENGNKAKIWIQTQKKSDHPIPGMLGQGIRMSSGEVYAHEMVHHITHSALTSERGGHLRRQATSLYNQARKSFEEQYGANAFLVFMNEPNADLNDPANVSEIAAAKARWDYIFNPKQNADNTHDGLDEFIAFGMTNENFKDALAQLPVDYVKLNSKHGMAGLFEKNIQKTVVNIFGRIMDFIHNTFYNQKHSKTMDMELENLVTALTAVDSKKKSFLWRVATEQEARLTALSVKLDEKIKASVVAKAAGTKIGQAWTQVKKTPELHNFVSDQMRKVVNYYNDGEYGMTKSIITELKGNTSRLRPFHDLLSKRKLVLDAAKEEAATNVKATVNSWFDRELTENEKVAITKIGLKSDVSGLMDYSSMNAIRDFLKGSNIREQRIQYLMKQIADDPVLNPYRNYFEKASDNLGFFMVTGNGKPGGVPMWNAHNIATLKNTKYEGYLSDTDVERARHLVEQLASLSAMRYTSINHNMAMANLIDENMAAVEKVFEQHNLLKDDALQNSFHGQRGKMMKGYTKQILNSRIQYEQGTKADKDMYEQAGYIMNETPIERDPADPVQTPIYMFKSMLGTTNDLLSGIASFTSNKAKGTNSYRIQNQIGNVYSASQQGDNNRKIIMDSMKKRLNSMFSDKPMNTQGGNANYMIPQFNDSGEMVDARYMMNEHTKDYILEQHSNFDDVLAGMTSQLIDKEQTAIINSDLVSALKDLYDAEYAKNPDAYIEISPYSNESRHRDTWYMMTPRMREEIKSTFGDDRLFISKDVMDISFGNRKFTIGEMFNKTKQERSLFERTMVDVLNFTLGWNNVLSKNQVQSKQGRALVRAKTVEDWMIQVTKLAKNNIIVRNFSVTRGNYASNMAYLKSKGISLEKISADSRIAIESALRYQSDKSQLDTFKLNRDIDMRRTSINQATKDVMLKNYNRKIMELENALALNPSTAMIEAGLMPQIVDDVDTGKVQSPYKFGLDKLIDDSLEKLPGKAQDVGRTLFMTEDTEGYKILNNAVKMTDYVGRFVLYRHYTSQEGMSHEDAVTAVTEEFVNFDLPTHRLIEYANNIGFIWFSKYQLRILKQIGKLVKDHPFTTLATFIIGSQLGNNNILNSVPGLTKDAMQAFGDPMSSLTSSIDQILAVNVAETPFNY